MAKPALKLIDGHSGEVVEATDNAMLERLEELEHGPEASQTLCTPAPERSHVSGTGITLGKLRDVPEDRQTLLRLAPLPWTGLLPWSLVCAGACQQRAFARLNLVRSTLNKIPLGSRCALGVYAWRQPRLGSVFP